jgi:hypothetical protein
MYVDAILSYHRPHLFGHLLFAMVSGSGEYFHSNSITIRSSGGNAGAGYGASYRMDRSNGAKKCESPRLITTG